MSARIFVLGAAGRLGHKAAEAFRFANRAMWLQRIRSIYALARRRGESITLEAIDAVGHRPRERQLILIGP